GGRRVVAFLGGTIGNLLPNVRARFLAQIADGIGSDDAFLLGTDLVKDPARLVAAYDDSAGVTAEFNRNVLHVMNRELGADFDTGLFEHVAFFDAARGGIRERLRSTVRQQVAIPAVALEIEFAPREELRTEISAKFTPERLE